MKAASQESLVELSAVTHIEALVTQAHALGASDIHIDPSEQELVVRFRIDGILQDSATLPSTLHPQLLSRLKVLSHLRTDEHQAPQDGRFRFEISKTQTIDVRISFIPTYHGERVVLRLLSPTSALSTLEDLGLSAVHQTLIERALQKPQGMILATGPTGSGKTTTLYTLIALLNTRARSIITIEDPIEYSISGVSQIQTNPRAGLTFETGLRSILRQDPNIIMVGEIRDTETAGLAVNAALTGHLVLSTLHTSDAPTALPRLRDMHIEPYLIASTVSLVIGQRLVRRLCDLCKKEKHLTKAERVIIQETLEVATLPETLFRAEGCTVCGGSGYSGRIGMYEVLLIDDVVREAMSADLSTSGLRKIVRGRGMTSMLHDGLRKVGAGTTSIEEILRIHHE